MFLRWNKQHIWGESATCCQHLNAVPGRGVLIDGFKALSVNCWTKLSGGWNVKRARLQEAGLLEVGSGLKNPQKGRVKIKSYKRRVISTFQSPLTCFFSHFSCHTLLRERGQELLTPFYRGSQSISDLPKITQLFIGRARNGTWSPGHLVRRKMKN